MMHFPNNFHNLNFECCTNLKKKYSLIADNTSTKIKDVTYDMIAWKTAGTILHQQLPAYCHATIRDVGPLSEILENRPVKEDF